MTKNLMELPPSSVWIHEKAIYHLISAPKGETFGERNSLTCLMNGITKGYCGNKKTQEHVMLGYHAELQKEDNGTHISYQAMGDDEPFSRGELLGMSLARPRWFRLGEPAMELALQTAIVGELTGQSVDQPDPVNRRRANNFMAFVRGDVKMEVMGEEMCLQLYTIIILLSTNTSQQSTTTTQKMAVSIHVHLINWSWLQ